ncbi:MAG: hypothetical protein M1840_008600 [Geoglossum simile]|nr:MAG: hypothetical protein M1840_008600 [Geoglossum simile]
MISHLSIKGKHKGGALTLESSQELVRLCVHLQAACQSLSFSKYNGDPKALVLQLNSRYGWQADALNRLEANIKDYLSEALSYELDWDLATYLPNPPLTPPLTPDQLSRHPSYPKRNKPNTVIPNSDTSYHDYSPASSSGDSLATPGFSVINTHSPNTASLVPQYRYAPFNQGSHIASTSRVWSETSRSYSLVGTVEGKTPTSWVSRKLLDDDGIEFTASRLVAKVDYNGMKLSSTGIAHLSFIPSGVRMSIDWKFNVHENNDAPELLVGVDIYSTVLRHRNSHSFVKVATDWAREHYSFEWLNMAGFTLLCVLTTIQCLSFFFGIPHQRTQVPPIHVPVTPAITLQE